MVPADAADDDGLYQPPRPPLPAPPPYTHPRPVLPAAPPRPTLSPAPSLTRLTQQYQQQVTSNSQLPSQGSSSSSGSSVLSCGPQPLPGLAQGPAPHFLTATPLVGLAPRSATPQPQPPVHRYPPFQPLPEYRPPPNPRVGAAGLPPSVSGPDELPPPSFLHSLPRSPLGGTGSVSCPTSLSQQAVPPEPAPLSTSGYLPPSVPGPGCWSLPRDPHGAAPDMAGVVAHERGASAPAAMVVAPGEELKTRSLPTRCLHGARPPLVARRNLVMSEGEGGGPGSSSLLCEEDGFYFNQPLLEEHEEDLYGSSEDLSSGPSILEKLMVWAYYNAEGEPQEPPGTTWTCQVPA